VRIHRLALIKGIAAAANHERERRHSTEEARHTAARERLYTELDAMAARLRAVQGEHEPSEEERERSLHELDAWFAQHFSQADLTVATG
jgi:hypothetical protein